MGVSVWRCARLSETESSASRRAAAHRRLSGSVLASCPSAVLGYSCQDKNFPPQKEERLGSLLVLVFHLSG